jgi:ABC-2 type transport system ATP-binding protein
MTRGNIGAALPLSALLCACAPPAVVDAGPVAAADAGPRGSGTELVVVDTERIQVPSWDPIDFRLVAVSLGTAESGYQEGIDEVAEALDITDLLDRQAGKLSGGQKRRVHTAIALLHRPRLLLLDEATTGADVETRGHILDLVRQLAADGSAVLYSTHYLAEVESLESSVAILDQGRVIARGDVRGLIDAHTVPVVELAFAGGVPAVAFGDGATVDGDRVRLPTRDPAATLVEVLPRLPADTLSSVEIVRPSLEGVYLALAGRRYDEADREADREAAGDGAADEQSTRRGGPDVVAG